jgi:hypothetical protein
MTWKQWIDPSAVMAVVNAETEFRKKRNAYKRFHRPPGVRNPRPQPEQQPEKESPK